MFSADGASTLFKQSSKFCRFLKSYRFTTTLAQSKTIYSDMDSMNKSDCFADLCQKCKITPKVGFVGGGNMAQALISGFVSSGVLAKSDLVVADPLENIRKTLSDLNIKAVPLSSQLIDSVSNGIIILAVKPSSVPDFYRCLSETKNGAPGLLISVCAGITLKNMEDALLSHWKNIPIVRVMPNTPALVGYGASAFSIGHFASVDHTKIVQMLVGYGWYLRTSTRKHDGRRHPVLSGSGPAFIYTIIDALSDGGVKVGLPRDIATKLAVQTVLGSAEMVKKTGKHPGELKNMVCSPGGTTIAGIHVLEEAKIRSALISAVEAATKRSKELGDK